MYLPCPTGSSSKQGVGFFMKGRPLGFFLHALARASESDAERLGFGFSGGAKCERIDRGS